MGQITKDNSSVCPMPPTLMTSGIFSQKPLTITMSLSEHTIAAFLQLALAFLFLLLGLVSSNVTNILWTLLTEYTRIEVYLNFLAPLSFVILPLTVSAIGFGLFYRLGMSDKNAWNRSLLFNFLGLLMLLAIFLPVVANVQYLYFEELFGRGPERWLVTVFHPHDNVWSILSYLIPLTMILNLASIIYLGARHLSVTTTSNRDLGG